VNYLNDLITFLMWLAGWLGNHMMQLTLWAWEHPGQRDLITLLSLPSIVLLVFALAGLRAGVRTQSHK